MKEKPNPSQSSSWSSWGDWSSCDNKFKAIRFRFKSRPISNKSQQWATKTSQTLLEKLNAFLAQILATSTKVRDSCSLKKKPRPKCARTRERSATSLKAKKKTKWHHNWFQKNQIL